VASEAELLTQIKTLGAELQRRAQKSRKLNGYMDGNCPFPAAVIRAKLTKAYKLLMPMAEAPWGSLVVSSVQDRLEVAGVRDALNPDAAEAVWGAWQDNSMDAGAKLVHCEALVDGRAFATVWPENGGPPQITLDSSDQVIVQYAEGTNGRVRTAALRFWLDGDVANVTLYRPDGIYKYRSEKSWGGFESTTWIRREVLGEDWPLANPYKVVPVVELAVNRRLRRAGTFGRARGEFEHVTGLIDRINLLTFLGLIVALWMGFPLRGVIGDKILQDDDGNMLPPFDADADTVFQLENKEAKLAEFKAADRGNLSIFAELSQLAYITKTPAHYFPLDAGLSNISADAIRALEGGLHAKVTDHKASLGSGHQEILRLAGLMLAEPVQLSPRAEVLWKDSESRSLAERADAATKLKDILPWQAIAETVLNGSQDEINRWQAMRSSDALSTLLAAATEKPSLPAAA
jgi:hypothetical protein